LLCLLVQKHLHEPLDFSVSAVIPGVEPKITRVTLILQDGGPIVKQELSQDETSGDNMHDGQLV
jgi:hypothetical protein